MSNQLKSMLRAHKFLSDVPDEDVERIASVASILDFEANQIIFREGEPSTNIFLIEHGNVGLEICAPGVGCKRVMTVGDDELLGWSPLLGVSALTATARTIEESRVIAIDSQKLLAICDSHPSVGFTFMQHLARALARRLNATRLQLMDVFGDQMAAANQGFDPESGNLE